MKISLFAIGATLLISGIANAEVVIVGGLPTAHVSYRDLNLQSDEGLNTLRARVRGAARMVCGDSPSVESVPQRVAVRSCVNRAIANGDRQMSAALAHGTSTATLAAEILTIRAQ